MMAAVHLQVVDGAWDPCASKLFFSGMEYDHEVEEIAMKRRSIEIDALFEQKVLNMTVEVSSPKDVEASFLKDLGELVLRANEKLHIVTVNSKFAPTKFVTLDVFLKKHGGSSNDAVRDLYNELTQFFLSRQIWEQDQGGDKSDTPKPKGKAKSKAAAKKAEDNPAEATEKAEVDPAEAAASADNVDNPKFVTPKKGSQSPSEVTPQKLEEMFRASDTYDVADICNVEGPCMLQFTKDQDGYTQMYSLKLVESKDCQFRGSDVLTLLSHPELSVSDQEPSSEDLRVKFQVHDETKVVVDWGKLDKKSTQVDSLSAVILKAVNKHKLQVALEGYDIVISPPPPPDALEEPSSKKRKTQLVSMNLCNKDLYLTGPEAFLIMMDELLSVTTPSFAIPWYLRAEVSDTLCTFKLVGIAVMPVGKAINFSHEKTYIIAVPPAPTTATAP